MTGPLALIGGSEWTEGSADDRELLEKAGGRVTVLPTAAAYENPGRAIDRARAWYEERGAELTVVPVYRRPDALDPKWCEVVGSSGYVFLTSGSSMHLRSVLMESPLVDAAVSAWRSGAVLAAAGHSATTLCDPMVDGRGGALTVGLGVVEGITVVPRLDEWSEDKLHRTLQLAPPGLSVVGLEHRACLLYDGGWSVSGAGRARAWRDGHDIDVADLPPPY